MVPSEIHKRVTEDLIKSTLKEAKKKRLLTVIDGIHYFTTINNEAYIHQADLAAHCGCGLTTIKKATRELQELGYLEVGRTKRASDQKYHWNTYALTYPPGPASVESGIPNQLGMNGWIHNPTWEYVKPLLTKGSVHLHDRHGGARIVSVTESEIVLLDDGLVTRREAPEEFLNGYGAPPEEVE